MRPCARLATTVPTPSPSQLGVGRVHPLRRFNHQTSVWCSQVQCLTQKDQAEAWPPALTRELGNRAKDPFHMVSAIEHVEVDTRYVRLQERVRLLDGPLDPNLLDLLDVVPSTL